MAISVVQTKTNTGAGVATLAVTLTATVAQNTLIVCVGNNGTNFPPTGVATSGGQNLTLATQSLDGNNANATVWYLDNAPGGQTSVTVTWSSGPSHSGVVAYEVSGVYAAGGSFDQTAVAFLATGSPTAWTSGASPTLSQSAEIAIGCSAQIGISLVITGPASPWTNTQAVSSGGVIAGQKIVAATTAVTYNGSTTHSGTEQTATVVATFKAGTPPPPGPALTVAQVTVAALPPAPVAGPMALTVAQEAEAAPAPVAGVSVPLTVAQVTVAARPVQPPVFLAVAQVNVAAPVVTPTVGVVLAIPAAQVSLSAPAPSLGGSVVALGLAAVTVAAPAPGASLGRNVNLTVAAEVVAARPPAPSVSILLALTTARVTIAANAPKVSRQLLISLASKAGTDDYGTAFPQGILATAGVIEGPTLVGSDAFFYNGTPALGNLVQSITEADGTDQFGNAYIAGTTTYNSVSFLSAVSVGGGSVIWYTASVPGGPWTIQAAIGFSFNALTGGNLVLQGTNGTLQLPSGGTIPQSTPAASSTAIIAALQAAGIFH